MWILLIPPAAAVLFAAAGIHALRRHKTAAVPPVLRFLAPSGKPLTTRSLLSCTAFLTGLELLLLGLLSLVISCFTVTERGLSPAAVLVMSVLPFLAMYLDMFRPQKTHLCRLLRRISICAAVIMAAEVLLCGSGSLSAKPFSQTLTAADIQSSEDAPLSIRDGVCTITGDSILDLTGIPEGTHAIVLEMEQEQTPAARLVHVILDMKDDNYAYSNITVSDGYTMARGGGYAIALDPYGSVHSLRLTVNEVTAPVTIRAFRALSAMPFQFSDVRYFLVLLLAAAILCILEYRLYAVSYDPAKRTHCAAVCCMVILCTLSAALCWEPGQKLMRYTKGDDYTGSDPYVQTFDAFKKGQVYLDITADPALETLDNVYDYSERAAKKAPTRWDYAYYQGKYYSYFGVTPVLVFYYPLYMLTGKLPTVPITVDLFSTCSALLLCLTILAAVRLMVHKPNLLLLLLCLPAAECCAGVYVCLQYPDKYYVAVSGGMCFLLLTLWLGLRACAMQKLRQKCVLLALSGAALALCAGARPTMAVSAVILLPFFFGILCKKGSRPVQAGCFLLPLLAGIGGLLAYNAARFGSPLDFGSAYQLTVSDVHANTLQPGLFPAAIRQYFLQFPTPRSTFPFFEPINYSMRNYGRYVYTDATYGALSHPAVLTGLLLLPAALRKRRMAVQGSTALQQRACLILCFAAPVILAWLDFCMGGVNQRYVTDIMPLLAIGAVLVLLRTAEVRRHGYR